MKQTKNFIEQVDLGNLGKILAVDMGAIKNEYNTDLFLKILKEQPIQIVESKPTIKESVDVLCNTLKEDEDYYRSWKDNIAMAFKDECYRNQVDDDLPLDLLHKIANTAADNFLQQLVRDKYNKKLKFMIVKIKLKESCLREGNYYTTFRGKEMCLYGCSKFNVNINCFADLDNLIILSDVETLTIEGHYE
jgi:hypothetical protein